MKSEYTPPSFKGDGFHCSHCGVFAHQHWYDVTLEGDSERGEGSPEVLSVSTCEKCSKFSIWIDGKIIYPGSAAAPFPLGDMPEEIKKDFLEARRILDASPRAATALLRLALQKLVSRLGEEEESAESSIENLRKRGLDVKFQKALQSVRMIGEDAVNPGQIDSRDDAETALILFNLLNLIVETLITQPRRVDEILEKLPDQKKRQGHNQHRFSAG
ncbi:MAG: DUF4145 domain-containing protein [Candidatus Bathyarchaeota archaeon]|nr:MAG: DUF4145 domain-containing protein [Candidatus Bathyarchaeota archaeon]